MSRKGTAYIVDRDIHSKDLPKLEVREIPVSIREKTVVVDSTDRMDSFGIAHSYRRTMRLDVWTVRHSSKERAIAHALHEATENVLSYERALSRARTRLEEIEALR